MPPSLTAAFLSYADLHQIFADNQLPGKVLFRLDQMPDRSIAGYDVVKYERNGAEFMPIAGTG